MTTETAVKKIKNHTRMLALAMMQRPGLVDSSTFTFLLEGLKVIDGIASEIEASNMRSA